ncbi:MAG: SGNH/GDSL hydrolase family protein [Candidatus Thorarchaeota archaeon]
MNKINILCIGDSHTAGFPLFDPLFGGNPKSSYEYWFNNHLSKQFSEITFVIHNKGSCGQVSREVLRRLNNALETFSYDLIILWAGANDIAIGYSVERIWENLWQAYKISVEKSKAFMLVTIPPMNWPGIDTKIGQLNEEIRINSNSDTYMYADAYAALVLENEDVLNPIYDAGDGVHLSIDGYEQIGKVIFNQTVPLIQKIVRES